MTSISQRKCPPSRSHQAARPVNFDGPQYPLNIRWSEANELQLVQRLYYARCEKPSHTGMTFTALLRFRLESACVEAVALALCKRMQAGRRWKRTSFLTIREQEARTLLNEHQTAHVGRCRPALYDAECEPASWLQRAGQQAQQRRACSSSKTPRELVLEDKAPAACRAGSRLVWLFRDPADLDLSGTSAAMHDTMARNWGGRTSARS